MLRSMKSLPAVTRALPALLLLAGLAATQSKAHAQTSMGETADVRFEFVNATRGEPGTVDRLTIDYNATRSNLVLDIAPEGSSLLVQDVPVKDVGNYVVTAWKDGVPYYFSRKGRQLMSEVQVLHVFETSTDRADVHITGLTAVVRREESLLHVELMLQVQNDARPQVTVVGEPGSFGLVLPAELTDIAAEYHRGLEPTPVAATRAEGRLQLAVPLVSGGNRVRLTGVLNWREGMELGIGSDRPIDAWGLLVSPDWTQVTSMELEPDPDGSSGGYKRFVGPALAAGRTLSFRLGAGEAAADTIGELFTTTDKTAAEPVAEAQKKKPGLPLPILIALGVIVLVLVMRRRRA